jgi:hypothetical protein
MTPSVTRKVTHALREVAPAVEQDGPALGVDVGGLELGQVEVHPAEVLDLGVEGVRVEAARPHDDPVGSRIVEVGESDEAHLAGADADGGRPRLVRPALRRG